MYICLHLKYILVYPILMKIEFPRQISRNPKTINFMKIRRVVTELLHADRQDTNDESNSDFSQFCEST